MAKGRKRSTASSSSSSDYSQDSSASTSSSSSPRKKRKGSAAKSKRSHESGMKDRRGSSRARRQNHSRKQSDKEHSRGAEQSGNTGVSLPAPDAANAGLTAAAANAGLTAAGMFGISPGHSYVDSAAIGFSGYHSSGWPVGAQVFPGTPPPRPLPPPGHLPPPHTLPTGPLSGHLPPPHTLPTGTPPPRPLPPGAAFPRPPGFGPPLPPAGMDNSRLESRARGGTNDDRATDFGTFGGRGRGRSKRESKPKWVPGQGRNPDLEAERKTGFGLASAWSEHDDRRGDAETKRRRAPSPSGSWKHDLFDEVMKSDATDAKAKRRR